VILPTRSTPDAARGRSSVLAGVGPKKMQSAVPGGHQAISPTSMSSRAEESSGRTRLVALARFPYTASIVEGGFRVTL